MRLPREAKNMRSPGWSAATDAEMPEPAPACSRDVRGSVTP
jgi:hypothetical protein